MTVCRPGQDGSYRVTAVGGDGDVYGDCEGVVSGSGVLVLMKQPKMTSPSLNEKTGSCL